MNTRLLLALALNFGLWAAVLAQPGLLDAGLMR